MNVFEAYKFNLLTPELLYQILTLRSEVFVLEQQCAYQDMDGLDRQSYHVLAKNQTGVFAYARILPPELHKDSHASIGRVVVAAHSRSGNWGKKLMQHAVKVCQNLYPNAPIEIAAQSYLTRFYHDLGFVNSGDFYLEDDIPHQTMIYQAR